MTEHKRSDEILQAHQEITCVYLSPLYPKILFLPIDLVHGVEIVERTGGLLVLLLVGFTVLMLLVVGEYRTAVLSLLVFLVITNGVNRQRKTSAMKKIQPYSKFRIL